jgi:hypothetical protein
VDRLTAAFGPEGSWRSVSVPARRISYTRRDTTLADLLVSVRREAGDLVVLDPGREPHGVVHGPVGELLELLATASPFAFALSGEARSWLVLDTAENVLVVAGDLP